MPTFNLKKIEETKEVTRQHDWQHEQYNEQKERSNRHIMVDKTVHKK
jgi:hypothetical protein